MRTALAVAAAACLLLAPSFARPGSPREPVATFSIVGRDPATGELGVAVASRFFAVGTVVPWARAGAGAVATQSFANTTYGPRGLDLLARGATAKETLELLLRGDPDREKRQVGIVAADGSSATYTGKGCNAWAGGRSGPGYAAQGNILAGEAVVAAMEEAFLATKGNLAERLFAALAAGDSKGGDARGRQSAAILVVKDGAGYGGYTDRAIDLRVDDHPNPFAELRRLLDLGQVNHAWNEGWTAFTERRFKEALVAQERAAALAASQAAVLPEVLYDLAVIRLAAGDRAGAADALERAVGKNRGLATQARGDPDLAALRGDPAFERALR